MSYDEFYNLTPLEIGYWLQAVGERELDMKKWQAKLAHYGVTNNSIGFHSPKSLKSLEKDFPSLFTEELSEDEQEARFFAGVDRVNKERGYE